MVPFWLSNYSHSFLFSSFPFSISLPKIKCKDVFSLMVTVLLEGVVSCNPLSFWRKHVCNGKSGTGTLAVGFFRPYSQLRAEHWRTLCKSPVDCSLYIEQRLHSSPRKEEESQYTGSALLVRESLLLRLCVLLDWIESSPVRIQAKVRIHR